MERYGDPVESLAFVLMRRHEYTAEAHARVKEMAYSELQRRATFMSAADAAASVGCDYEAGRFPGAKIKMYWEE